MDGDPLADESRFDSTDQPDPPPDLPADPSITYVPASQTSFSAMPSSDGKGLPDTAKGTEDASFHENAPEAGTELRLRRLIGLGGFGEVWEGVQVSLGRMVAVKRIRDELLKERAEEPERIAELHRSFRQEAATVASLEHPNIVPIYDLGSDGEGRPLLAMKRLEGTLWTQRISREFNEMPVPDFLALHLPILVGVAQAVAFAHARGILHRDIKPSQVMVGEYGEVTLMDWGLAVVFDSDRCPGMDEREMSGLTALHTLDTASGPAGTAAFMAPEQTFVSQKALGPWTDVYLLGGTLYYLLCGRVPHVAPNARATYFKAMEGVVAPPQQAAPHRDVPAELSEIAMKAMSPKPGHRYRTAREFVHVLQEYMSGVKRRREAEALTAEVAAKLAAPGNDYRSFAELATQLARARALWPEVPRADAVQDTLQERYGEAALSREDLTLAQVQADGIGDHSRRVALLSRINQAFTKKSRRERQRRLAIAGAAVLGVAAFLTMGLVYVKSEEARYSEVEKRLAEKDAQLARERAAAAEAERQRERDLARLLADIDGLRRAEGALVERLSRDLPLPDKLDADRDRDPAAAARIDALLAERAELRLRRDRLAEATKALPGYRLEETPVQLVMAEANAVLARTDSTTQALIAYALYREAAQRMQNEPAPFTGMGIAASRSGYATSATIALERALTKTERKRGAASPEYAKALALAADAYRRLDDTAAAYKTYYERSLDLLEGDYAELGLVLAEQARRTGQYTRAESYSSNTLALVQRRYGEDSVEAARAYRAVAESIHGMGMERNRQYSQRAYEILRDRLGPDDIATVRAQIALAGITFGGERATVGRELFRDGIERMVRIFGTEEHPEVARAYFGYAGSLAMSVGVEEGLAMHRKALAIRERVLEPNHPETAQSCMMIGSTLWEQGKSEEGEAYLRRALRIREEVFGADHRYSATTREYIARVLRDRGDFLGALELQRRNVEGIIDSGAMDELGGAISMHNFAGSLADLGRIAEAAPWYRRSLATLFKLKGPRTIEVVRSAHHNARVLDDLGQHGEAERFFRYLTATLAKFQMPHEPQFAPATYAFASYNALMRGDVDMARTYAWAGRDETLDDPSLLDVRARMTGALLAAELADWRTNREAMVKGDGLRIARERAIVIARAAERELWESDALTRDMAFDRRTLGLVGIWLVAAESLRGGAEERALAQRSAALLRCGDFATTSTLLLSWPLLQEALAALPQRIDGAPRLSRKPIAAAEVSDFVDRYGAPLDWEAAFPDIGDWTIDRFMPAREERLARLHDLEARDWDPQIFELPEADRIATEQRSPKAKALQEARTAALAFARSEHNRDAEGFFRAPTPPPAVAQAMVLLEAEDAEYAYRISLLVLLQLHRDYLRAFRQSYAIEDAIGTNPFVRNLAARVQWSESLQSRMAVAAAEELPPGPLAEDIRSRLREVYDAEEAASTR